ncbi:hypothetical protein M1D97_02965 [Kushneria sp. AK178]
MSSDQASGLRQWSQAHAPGRATHAAPAGLVVMVWGDEGAGVEPLSQRLALPEGVSHWRPRPLVLSASLPEALPDTPWWVLHLAHLQADRAPRLAGALRRCHGAGMPPTVLLDAPAALPVAGLIRAVHAHLGVTLVQNAPAWHRSVTALSGTG